MVAVGSGRAGSVEASRRHAWLAQRCPPSRSSVHSFVHLCAQRGWSCIQGPEFRVPLPVVPGGLEARSSSFKLRADEQATGRQPGPTAVMKPLRGGGGQVGRIVQCLLGPGRCLCQGSFCAARHTAGYLVAHPQHLEGTVSASLVSCVTVTAAMGPRPPVPPLHLPGPICTWTWCPGWLPLFPPVGCPLSPTRAPAAPLLVASTLMLGAGERHDHEVGMRAPAVSAASLHVQGPSAGAPSCSPSSGRSLLSSSPFAPS